MNKNRRPRLTISFLKFMYLTTKKPTKKNKVHCAYGGKMKEEDFIKYSNLINELKNELPKG